jgi:hypothetical protein
MSAANTTRWIGIGLLGLPLYGVLTFFSSLDPQPDPNTDYEAWAYYVSTNYYVLKHLFGSILGLVFALFGTIALGAYLARSHAGRLGLAAMVITVFGYALFLTIGGVSTFASPGEGQAYVAGDEEFAQIAATGFAVTAQTLTLLLSTVLLLVGNVLLGVAIWRSRTLPRWAGVLWAAGAALMLVLGQVIAIFITGSTPVTVLVGAVLLVISGGWMAWSVLRKPSAGAVGVQAQPRRVR